MKTLDFISDDNPKSLFPLDSNVFFSTVGEKEINEFIYTRIFDDKDKDAAFIPSTIGYALKDNMHTRKTLVLDPISTYCFYDFAIKNRKLFQQCKPAPKMFYGYGFNGNKLINSFNDYTNFRKAKYSLKENHKYYAKIDIANCFNSFYHHDIVTFISNDISQAQSIEFGQLLREGNRGDSINCFPQGIYPAKLVGNHYLKFIEQSSELSSHNIIRFLDDIYLFDDNLKILEGDIMCIQYMLGIHYMALNSTKTRFGTKGGDFEERELDDVKKSLLQKREKTAGGYDLDEDEIELDAEEKEYLKSLLKNKDISEEDAEMALSLLFEYEIEEDEIDSLMVLVISKFPNLIKTLHKALKNINDESIWEDIIWKRLNRAINGINSNMSEFLLFWITRIFIDYFEWDSKVGDTLVKLYNNPNATELTKGIILEMPENNFGMYELKERVLRNSPGGIESICAIAGLRQFDKAKRNHIFKYLPRDSRIRLLSQICSKQ